MGLCGSSLGCGCGVTSYPAVAGAINGFLPTIDVGGSGVSGDPYDLSLGQWATEVANAINVTGGRWRRVAALSIPNNSPTAFVFDTEDADTGAMAAVPASSFTIPTAGLWHIAAVVLNAATVVNARHYVMATVTSTVTASNGVWRGSGYGDNVCTLGLALPLAAGDTVAFSMLQASGGAINYTGALAISNGVVR